MKRLFCERCGSDMLQRIAASVDGKTGRLRLHMSKKHKTSTRGTKFSLPKPGTVSRFRLIASECGWIQALTVVFVYNFLRAIASKEICCSEKINFSWVRGIKKLKLGLEEKPRALLNQCSARILLLMSVVVRGR